jgi:2-methylaconitate cis-trans-isomerase PrpF
MLLVVRAPAGYSTGTDSLPVAADDIDLVVRQFATGAASKALAATISATTAVACLVPGTVAAAVVRAARAGCAGPRRLAFGHPSGIIHVDAEVHADGVHTTVRQASIQRTARRLAEGRAYLHQAF